MTDEHAREAILAMPAGPELDELIERHIFGWKGTRIPDLPAYSTSIADAWKIVEQMEHCIDHDSMAFNKSRGKYHCWFVVPFGLSEKRMATADTAPLAISKAALLATTIK